MALQKRQDIETNELKGVVLAVDESKIKPGVFIQLSNWKPSGIGSIQKKRGVAALASAVVVPVAPTETCAEAPVGTPPTAPSNLIATTDSDSQITLTWDDNAGDEVYFSIERCEGTGCANFLEIDTVLANIETYVDTDLEPDTTYAYRVRAVNDGGPSAYSNTDEATTDPLDDPPITGLRVWLLMPLIGLNDSDPIDTWLDSSGEGNDFTGAGAARPLYRTTTVTINGFPVAYFDGVDDLLSTVFTTTGFTAASIFIVAQVASDPPAIASKTGLWRWNPSNFDTHMPYTDGVIYDGSFTTARKTVGNEVPSLAGPFQYNVISASGSWKARLNGVEVFATASNTVATGGTVQIGKSDGAYFFNGAIAEILVYDEALSDGDRDLVELYLATKYDL